MKSIRIQTLTLKNFKGIKEFTLKADGENLNVFGDNATGKTTLYDAFIWLLFDKDSANQKAFEIKTIIDGKAANRLDHEVEAALNIDGSIVKLKKTYREDWTRKRGSATETFSGHETVYFIDDVPKKKNEYNKYIDSIAEEEIFKLLTSPSFFNHSIKWQDRRSALLRVAGEVSNDEIFKSSDKLKGLAVIMEGRKIEDFKKMKAAEKTKINAEIEKIPVRIDEIQLSIPEGSADVEKLTADIEALDAEINALNEQINVIQNGKALNDLRLELQSLTIQKNDLKREIEDGSRENVYRIKTKIQEEEGNLRIIERRRDDLMREMGDNIKRIDDLKEKMDALRPKYTARKKEEFKAPEACGCPTCGQDLPADQIEAANEKAKAAFNLKKSADLEEMASHGKWMKSEFVKISEANAVHSDSLEGINADIIKKDKTLAKLKEDLKTAENGVQDASTDNRFINLEEKAHQVENEIQNIQNNAAEAIEGIREEIAELKAKRAELSSQASIFANVPNLEKRIAELEAQQEKLAEAFEKAEEHIYLADEFIRAQVRIMEERINSKFKIARFKLFAEQINGGLSEVCETQVNGVTYSNLNNAMKTNVGIDIINTLSAFHGLQATIFMDNAESVVDPLHTDSQMIRLVVSGEDKKLRVEAAEAVGV